MTKTLKHRGRDEDGRDEDGRDEDGIALITSLLVMMVCVILVAAAAQLAIHTNQRSGLTRNRSASLHAAEAGIEAALSTLSASALCPAAGSEVQLPDQNLPSESYKVLAPVSCTPGGNAVIAAVGYVPNATRPVATTTIVAHINRGEGAPVSGGSGTNGGYIFPDAVFSGGTITAAGVNTLSAYGTGGTVPNIVGNGAINISGSQLDGLVHGWSSVNLNVPAIGGEVVGNGVTLSGATVQAGTNGVFSSGSLTLSGSTINGPASYKTAFSSSTSTVTGGASQQPTNSLPLQRLMPTFSDVPTDMRDIVNVSYPPSNTCPGTGTGSHYNFTLNLLTCTYNPATINGTVVVVVHGGTTIVNVPQTTTGGQLYVIAVGLTSLTPANLVINGTNSNLPVFAYTDGLLTTNLTSSGGITGQLLGGSVATGGPTTLTFSPPSIPAPDFAFNSSQVAPSGLGFAANIDYQYQCPGTTAC